MFPGMYRNRSGPASEFSYERAHETTRMLDPLHREHPKPTVDARADLHTLYLMLATQFR